MDGSGRNSADSTVTAAVDVVTVGETMVLFHPLQEGPLAYAPLWVRSIAGAESNLCIALSRLGKRSRWISRLGQDPFGDIIASTLAGEGVDISLVERDPSAPTAVFFREHRGHGDPSVYYYRAGSAASKLSPADVQPEWFTGARLFHLTGITPALSPSCAAAAHAAAETARDAGLVVSFDPNLRRKLWSEEDSRSALMSLLKRCDIFLPGVEEAEFLFGAGSPESYADQILETGPSLVVLKQGDQGASAFTRTCRVQVPAHPLSRVADTIGAGDAFAAGFVSILLDEPDLRDQLPALMPDALQRALERANLLGALATQFKGDWEGLPTLAELEQILAGRQRVTR